MRGLTVTYRQNDQSITSALKEVHFQVAPGEIVGILGESGCGKSTLALSLLGLLPPSASVDGSIKFQGDELVVCTESRMRCIRGASISLIHQNASTSLSPVMRIGDQISEVFRAHVASSRALRRQCVEALLREVHLSDTKRFYDAYPHQLSGGELQRVTIAQSLICGPSLIVADEPTQALDVTIQAEILNLLRDVNRKRGVSFIFITHNPALLAGFAHRVVVMHSGRVVEEGPVKRVFQMPLASYTKSLLGLVPRTLSGHSGIGSRSEIPKYPEQLSKETALENSRRMDSFVHGN